MHWFERRGQFGVIPGNPDCSDHARRNLGVFQRQVSLRKPTRRYSYPERRSAPANSGGCKIPFGNHAEKNVQATLPRNRPNGLSFQNPFPIMLSQHRRPKTGKRERPLRTDGDFHRRGSPVRPPAGSGAGPIAPPQHAPTPKRPFPLCPPHPGYTTPPGMARHLAPLSSQKWK